MILVTGGTGFIGQNLARTLVSLGYPVRLLLNPASDYPKLPRGISIEVAISSMNDERNLRAAMKGVQYVFHFIGTEWKGIDADYENVDVLSARMFSQVAAQMNVSRFFYLSHLGADRASAYAFLRAKAQAEAAIVDSGVPYTILRTAVAYGENDRFTTTLRDYAKALPFLSLMPGGDECRIQPVWVEDLITCLMLCMDDQEKKNKILSIGGMEVFTFRECMEMVMAVCQINRRMISLPPVWMRNIQIANEQWFKKFPRMYFWLDYLTEDRLAPLDILPREFGLMPTRLSRNISYLAK